jgi:hypothetical protein
MGRLGVQPADALRFPPFVRGFWDEEPSELTYRQIKHALTRLGFRQRTHANGVALEHETSNTVFLFRPHNDNDRLQVPEVSSIRWQLDERGLLSDEEFEEWLAKPPS